MQATAQSLAIPQDYIDRVLSAPPMRMTEAEGGG
jgi:hypothetical protein